MKGRAELALATLILAIGTAGPPLEPLSIVLAALLCTLVWRSGKFVGALALAVTVGASWLQHHQFRISALALGAFFGIAAHLYGRNERTALPVAAAAAVIGVALLLIG